MGRQNYSNYITYHNKARKINSGRLIWLDAFSCLTRRLRTAFARSQPVKLAQTETKQQYQQTVVNNQTFNNALAINNRPKYQLSTLLLSVSLRYCPTRSVLLFHRSYVLGLFNFTFSSYFDYTVFSYMIVRWFNEKCESIYS